MFTLDLESAYHHPDFCTLTSGLSSGSNGKASTTSSRDWMINGYVPAVRAVHRVLGVHQADAASWRLCTSTPVTTGGAAMSKFFDGDDWQLNPRVFRWLDHLWGTLLTALRATPITFALDSTACTSALVGDG
jgi:hypothetical protein